MERIVKGLLIICLPVIIGLLVIYWQAEEESLEKVRKMSLVFSAIQDYTSRSDLAAVTTVDGVKQSWRVALYPYLTNDHFAAYYDTKMPFDTSENLRAVRMQAASGRAFGGCYNTYAGGPPMQNVPATLLRVTGPGTLGEGFTAREIRDGLQNTILFIEDPESTVLWTSTEDFEVSNSKSPLIEKWLRKSPRIAMFANGDIRQLAEGLSKAEFQGMCTVAGGERPLLDKTSLLNRP